jgi:hypothetical protein
MDSRLTVALLAFLAPAMASAAPKPQILRVVAIEPLASAPPSAIAKQAQTLALSGMQPAPMPNPDFDPPHGDGPNIPNLSPALLSPKVEFQGNGFAPASSLAYGIDQRSKPAAGLNWSVPVK